MKTFRFTMPQLGPSAAEQRGRERYLEDRDLPPPQEDTTPRENPGATALIMFLICISSFRLAIVTGSEPFFSIALFMSGYCVYQFVRWLKLRKIPRHEWPSTVMQREVSELPLKNIDHAVINYAPIGLGYASYHLLQALIPTDGSFSMIRTGAIVAVSVMLWYYAHMRLSRYIYRGYWVKAYGPDKPMPSI